MSSTISSVLIIISTIIIVMSIGIASEGEHFLWLNKILEQSDITQSHAIPYNDFLTSLWASYKANYYDSRDVDDFYGYGDGTIDWKTARALELNGWINWEETDDMGDYYVYEDGKKELASSRSYWAGGRGSELAYQYYLDKAVSDYANSDVIKWGADDIIANSVVGRLFWNSKYFVDANIYWQKLENSPILIGNTMVFPFSNDHTISNILISAWENYTYASEHYNDMILPKSGGSNLILSYSKVEKTPPSLLNKTGTFVICEDPYASKVGFWYVYIFVVDNINNKGYVNKYDVTGQLLKKDLIVENTTIRDIDVNNGVIVLTLSNGNCDIYNTNGYKLGSINTRNIFDAGTDGTYVAVLKRDGKVDLYNIHGELIKSNIINTVYYYYIPNELDLYVSGRQIRMDSGHIYIQYGSTLCFMDESWEWFGIQWWGEYALNGSLLYHTYNGLQNVGDAWGDSDIVDFEVSNGKVYVERYYWVNWEIFGGYYGMVSTNSYIDGDVYNGDIVYITTKGNQRYVMLKVTYPIKQIYTLDNNAQMLSGGEDIKDNWTVYINGSLYSSPIDTTGIKRYHILVNYFDYTQSGGKTYKYSILDIYPSAYWHKVIGDSAIMSWLAWWEYFAKDNGSGDKQAVDSYIDSYGTHQKTITISGDGLSSSPYASSNEAIRKMIANALAEALLDKMKGIVDNSDNKIKMDINKLITWSGKVRVAVHICNVTIQNANVSLIAQNDSDSSVVTGSTCADWVCHITKNGESCSCKKYVYNYNATAWVKSTGDWNVTPIITFKIDAIKLYDYYYNLTMNIDNCWDGSSFQPYKTREIKVIYGNNPPVVINFSNNPIIVKLEFNWNDTRYLSKFVSSGYDYDTSDEAEKAGEQWAKKWISTYQPIVWNDLITDYQNSLREWSYWENSAIDLNNHWVVSAYASGTAQGGDEI